MPNLYQSPDKRIENSTKSQASVTQQPDLTANIEKLFSSELFLNTITAEELWKKKPQTDAIPEVFKFLINFFDLMEEFYSK